MTHMNNVPGIIQDGELKSYNSMRGHSYFNLANPDVQAGRATKVVPPTGRPLHEYVPLYFGNRTPMVAVNQGHNEDLVFIRFSLDLLNLGGVVICDGNARAGNTKFRLYTQIEDLAILDSKAINTVKYAGDVELKRRKQAEILVPEKLSLTLAYDFICYSNSAQQRLLEIFNKYAKRYHICISPGSWYFKVPQQGNIWSLSLREIYSILPLKYLQIR